MDESIKKFIKCLKGYINVLRKQNINVNNVVGFHGLAFAVRANSSKMNDIANDIVCVKNIICELEIPREEWERDSKVFTDFDMLSKYLILSNLSTKDRLNVIILFIEKNISTGIIDEDTKYLNPKLLKSYNLKKFNKSRLDEILYNGEINLLLQQDDSKLNSNEIKKKYELLSVLGKDYISSNIIKNNILVKKHYIDIEGNCTEYDIDKLINALLGLGVDESICKDIKNMLKKDLDNSIAKSSRKMTKEVGIISDYSNDREIKKELRNYFDFYRMEAIKPLSLKDRIYCVSLLVKLNADMEKIIKFLRISECDYNKQNPIVLYNQLYEKLKYYEEKYNLSNELNELEQYFSEIFIADTDDYEFWKSSIEENLNRVLKLIPRTYEYELDKASNKGDYI